MNRFLPPLGGDERREDGSEGLPLCGGLQGEEDPHPTTSRAGEWLFVNTVVAVLSF
jgi:hypothetical protein